MLKAGKQQEGRLVKKGKLLRSPLSQIQHDWAVRWRNFRPAGFERGRHATPGLAQACWEVVTVGVPGISSPKWRTEAHGSFDVFDSAGRTSPISFQISSYVGGIAAELHLSDQRSCGITFPVGMWLLKLGVITL